jgi:hypothetical protein
LDAEKSDKYICYLSAWRGRGAMDGGERLEGGEIVDEAEGGAG